MAIGLLAAIPTDAQYLRHTLIRPAESKSYFNVPNLTAAAHVQPLTLDLVAFRAAAAPELHLSAVPVSVGIMVDLDLTEFSVFTPTAALTSTGINGEAPLPVRSARLYKGKVAGDPESYAYLAIGDHDVIGSIIVRGKHYRIATDHTVPANTDQMALVSYPLADIAGSLVRCGVNDGNELALGGLRISKEQYDRMLQGTVPITVNFMVAGAFECDYEYSQLFKNDANPLQAATDYVAEIVGEVSAIYERDMNCQIRVGYLKIWTSTAATGYPYTEATSMDLALFQERDFWRANRAGVPRGFSHVLSGKAWKNPIGIAFLSVLCQPENAQAYSLITRLGTEQDVTVVAHENGHMFGSVHTQSCTWNPAIDSCAAAEGGSCFSSAQITPTTGTIMSYCAAKELKFHPKCAQVIRQNLLAIGLPCVQPGRKVIIQPHLTVLPKVKVNENRDSLLKDFYQNPSVSAVNVTDLQITGVHSERFTILEGKPPFVLNAGETKDLKIRYNSPVEEPSFGTFTVIHDGYNPPMSVYFEAYAEDPQPDLAIRVDATKHDINFGTLRLGEERDTTLSRMFYNAGRATVRVDSTWIVGPDKFDFQMTEGNAPFDINPGTSVRSARFKFKPQDTGNKEAYLVLQGNSKGHQYDTVVLHANVKRGPLLIIGVNGLAVNFGERQKRVQYDTAFAKFFYNAGSDTLGLGVDVYGQDDKSFLSAVTGIHELAPGDFLDLTISLYDTTDGIKRAFLKIDHIRYDTLGTGDEIYKSDTVQLIAFVGNWGSVPGGSAYTSEGMTVAPNPASNFMNVTFKPLDGEEGRSFTLRLTDITGREVYRKTDRFGTDATVLRISTEGFPNGIYNLVVETDKVKRLQRVNVAR